MATRKKKQSKTKSAGRSLVKKTSSVVSLEKCKPNTAEYYDAFYRKYGAAIHQYRARHEATANLVKGYRVLDFGCGTGDLLQCLSKHDHDLIGVDWSKVALKHAQSALGNKAEFYSVLGDLSGVFDVIVAAEVLEHMPEDEALTTIKALVGLLEPNGRLVISVPNGDRVPDPGHLTEFTMPGLRKILSPYGLVTFHPWGSKDDPGFKQRILCAVDKGVPALEPPITLVMTVKNESETMEDAILTAAAQVDEIVISVDTKSDDETRAIAQRYADEIVDHVWYPPDGEETDVEGNKGHAAARNAVLRALPPDRWVLNLDGHEFLKTDNIRKILTDVLEAVSTADVIYCWLHLEDDGFGNPIQVYPQERLYKAGCRWVGARHNHLNAKQGSIADPLIVHHDTRRKGKSYTDARVRQRKELDQGDLRPRAEQGETRATFYLANGYMGAGKWPEALVWYERYLRMKNTNAEERYCTLLYAARAAYQMREHDICEKHALFAVGLRPWRAEALVTLGDLYMSDAGQDKAVDTWKRAMGVLKRAADTPMPSGGHDLFIEPPIYLYAALDRLSVCYANLGQWDDAIAAAEKAKEHFKHPQLDENIKLWRAKKNALTANAASVSSQA